MRRNGFALASSILGTVYLFAVFFIFFFCDVFSNWLFSKSALLHVLFCAAAISINIAAYLNNARDGMLVSGIMYCIAAAIFILYAIYLVIPIVFSFVAFARMGSRKKKSVVFDISDLKSEDSITSKNDTEIENKSELLRFRVVGVSFKNEDRKSRQSILRKIKYRDPPFDCDIIDVELRPYKFEEEDAIGVYVNNMMIGNVPRSLVPEIIRKINYVDKITDFRVIGGGKDEDGNPLHYGAEICIKFDCMEGII